MKLTKLAISIGGIEQLVSHDRLALCHAEEVIPLEIELSLQLRPMLVAIPKLVLEILNAFWEVDRSIVLFVGVVVLFAGPVRGYP